MSGNVLPIANTIQLWNNKKLVSNLYQDDTNMRESAYRTLNRQNYTKSFSNVTMGSSSNFLNFNKDSIVNHVLVEFELPGVTAANVPNGLFLPRGWAWSLIRRYTMQYSGSNALEIFGRDNFIRCMAECETRQKREQLIALGGNAVYKNGDNLVGADADGKVKGAVLIYLPHSSISGLKQIGFDCSQCNSSPIINLDLAPSGEVWQSLKNKTDTATVITAIPATLETVNGKFYVGETAMIDSANSRRDMVGPNGPSQSLYFFAYPGNFEDVVSVPTSLGTVGTVLPSPLQTVTVNQFLNGSCQYLILYAERLDGFEDAAGLSQPDNVPKHNPLNLVRLQNIKVTYGGGSTIYEAESDRIANLIDTVVNPVDSSYTYTTVDRSGGVDIVTKAEGPNVGYFYRIQLAQFSELYKMFSLLQTGANLGSDNLKLSFQILDNFIQLSAPLNPIRYRISVQQVYQTSMTVARGNVKFDFISMSPQALPAQLTIST